MAAETLNCPMCGAPASSDATKCDHCGARLATVACPSCFGMMFAGAKFCSHCGAAAQRAEAPDKPVELCPCCRVAMQAVIIGGAPLEECPKCEGIWAERDALQRICIDRERQAAVLGMAAPPHSQPVTLEQSIHYVPCPVCKDLMNRVNFSHCSGIIVDVCNLHGTWFDKDELRRVVEFIRSGGLDRARTAEIADLNDAKRRAEATHFAGSMPISVPNYHTESFIISLVADLIKSLLR